MADQEIEIKITGLITSYPYQRAKYCAEKLRRHLPFKFLSPKIIGMLEFDWDAFITKQRRYFGGQLWAVTNPVIVYLNNTFLGSDEDFTKYIAHHYCFSIPLDEAFFLQLMLNDYLAFLRKSKRIYVCLDISIDNHSIGSMLFQLYSDLLPTTCCNFKCLCTGEKGTTKGGLVLHYKGTFVHRIAKTGWIQCGDIQYKTGGGGVSVSGHTFADESYSIRHDRRGILSMANDGKHTNGSQFFITLKPSEWMDYYYVAFGQLVEGVEVLKAIEAVDTFYEKPVKCIKIYDCGALQLEEKKASQPKRKFAKKEKSVVKKIEDKEIKDSEVKDEEKISRPVEDVLDMRDVPSILTEAQYLKGLYSFSVPETRIPSSCNFSHDYVNRILHFLETRTDPGVSHLPAEELKYESYATLIAQEIMTKSILKSDENNDVENCKTFALQIADEIVKRAMAEVDYEITAAKKTYITQVAEEIVKKSTEGADYYISYNDLKSFVSEIALELMEISLKETGSTSKFFTYSALIARDIINLSDGTQREYSNVYTMIETMIVEDILGVRDKAKEIVDTALIIVEDILGTVFQCMNQKTSSHETPTSTNLEFVPVKIKNEEDIENEIQSHVDAVNDKISKTSLSSREINSRVKISKTSFSSGERKSQVKVSKMSLSSREIKSRVKISKMSLSSNEKKSQVKISKTSLSSREKISDVKIVSQINMKPPSQNETDLD